MATVTSLGFNIFSRYDGDGVRRARRDMDDFDNSTRRNTNSLNSWAGRIMLATKLALTFAPALVPISANLAAVGAAAGAMATSVGTALGAYGLAMRGAIKNALALDKAHKSLTPAQKSFVTSVKGMSSAWQGFIKATQDKTLDTATHAVKGLTAGIGLLKPIVDAIHPTILQVSKDFEAWMKGDAAKNYANLIKTTAVPAVQNLVAAGKDVLNVLGDAFRAFLPTGVQLTQTIKNGAAALREWSDGGGFQRFLGYVQANKGVVHEFFTVLGQALKNLAIAFKDLGPLSLTLTTTMLKLVAALPPSWIETLVKGFIALKTVLLAYSAVQAIIAAVTAVTTGWSAAMGGAAIAATALDMALAPFLLIAGLVIAVVVALGVVVYLMVTRWKEFATYMSTSFMDAVRAVWSALQTFWGWIQTGFSTVWNGVQAAWSATWNGLKTAALAVWGALQVAWSAFVNGLATAWTTVSTALVTAWNAVWNALKVAAQVVWSAIVGSWTATVSALATAWTATSAALSSAWSAVWNAIKATGQAIWSAIQAAWTATVNALRTAWNAVSGALSSAWSTFWNALKAAAQAVWSALQGAWSAFLNAVRAAYNGFASALQSSWNAFWNAVKTAAQAIWTAMQTAWNAFLTAIRTIFATASAALKSAWDASWNAVKSSAQAIWDGIKNAWQAVLNAIKSVLDTVMNAIKSAWSSAWNTVHDTAKSIWDKITSTIQSAVDKIKGIIQSIVGVWNKIAGAVGLDSLKINLAKGGTVGEAHANGGIAGRAAYANGGVNMSGGGTLRGFAPGRDTVPAVLSRGEGVLVPEAVRGLGGANFIHWANRHFSNGRGGKHVQGASSLRAGIRTGGGDRPKYASGGIAAWHRDSPNGWSFAKGGIMGGIINAAVGAVLPNEIPVPGGGTAGQTPGKDVNKPKGSILDGIGNLAKSALGAIGDIGGWVLGFIGEKVIRGAFNGVMGMLGDMGIGGNFGKMMVEYTKKIVNAMIDKLVKEDAEAKKKYEAMAVAGAKSVQAWAPLAAKALQLAGLNPNQLGAFLRLMQAESGGNPNAINNWDVNAKNGVPSQGLMQVIPPTFSAYHVPGTSYNILDPLANMAAAANYIKHRYGGIVPGSPYATGTSGATKGWHLVGEQGPEMVRFRGGESVFTNQQTRSMVGRGGNGDVHVEMPITVQGNLDQAAVQKLDNEVIPKLRTLLVQGTGTRY